MTTKAEETDKAKAEAIKARNADMEAREIVLNSTITGKGLRQFLGMTKGRNPVEFQYENWDEKKPETLPKSVEEFMSLRVTDDAELLKRLILGDNDLLYAEASDPVKEFVEKTWPDEVQKQFRITVRNFAAMNDMEIADAVAVIKPSVVKSQAKKTATA